jgi:hypothetical protein
MPVRSSLPHLGNAAQCPAYLPTLRGKDRLLPCPRCQRPHMGRWGTVPSRPGCQRSWCPHGTRPCNDRPAPLWPQRQRPLASWGLAPCLRWLAGSSRRIARAWGGPLRTRERWGWWWRNAALSYAMTRQVAGPVAAAALSHTAGQKGQATQGGKKLLGRRARGRRKQREPGRGHEDKDRPAISAWVSRQGGCHHPGDQRLHRADGAESGQYRSAYGQPTVYRLRQAVIGR